MKISRGRVDDEPDADRAKTFLPSRPTISSPTPTNFVDHAKRELARIDDKLFLRVNRCLLHHMIDRLLGIDANILVGAEHQKIRAHMRSIEAGWMACGNSGSTEILPSFNDFLMSRSERIIP